MACNRSKLSEHPTSTQSGASLSAFFAIAPSTSYHTGSYKTRSTCNDETSATQQCCIPYRIVVYTKRGLGAIVQTIVKEVQERAGFRAVAHNILILDVERKVSPPRTTLDALLYFGARNQLFDAFEPQLVSELWIVFELWQVQCRPCCVVQDT